MSALSVLCSVLLACFGVSAVAVILSSSVSEFVANKVLSQTISFLFPVSLFLLFECVVVCSACALPDELSVSSGTSQV